MKGKLLKVLSLILVLVFLADVAEGYGYYRGSGRSAGGVVVVHGKRFIRKRIIRRPSIILKFHYPYYRRYYYPQRRYYYHDYGYRRNYYSPLYTTPYTPSYNTGSLSIIAIVDLARQGVPDDVIIAEIQRTGSVFHLNAEIIAYLRESRVSDRVIDYMMATSGRNRY